ncbi:MAG: hypothetical protein WC807_11230 [Hyphomicrobium sp.]
MQLQAIAAFGIIVSAVAAAALTLGDGNPEKPKKLSGRSEACTYYAGAKDQEMVEEGGEAGRRILREILKLERKCEFVSLVLADGTRHEMKLGIAGRKPGEKGPSSTGSDFDF